MEGTLADALGLLPEDDGGAKGICKMTALILCNACLLDHSPEDEPRDSPGF